MSDALSVTVDTRLWHIASLCAVLRYVRSWRQIRSEQSNARMTRFDPAGAWKHEHASLLSMPVAPPSVLLQGTFSLTKSPRLLDHVLERDLDLVLLGRVAFASGPEILRRLLQLRQKASIPQQGCVGRSPNSANRKHQIARANCLPASYQVQNFFARRNWGAAFVALTSNGSTSLRSKPATTPAA
jgi:hypothetical protein